MSFEIKIGYISDPRNKIKKSPKWEYELTGTLRDSCDVSNPSVDLRIGDSVSIKIPTLTKCNYMYIPNFNRYYYITNIRIVRNTIATVSGHVDVLKSFQSEILDNSVLVKRSAQKGTYTKMLDDGCFKVYNNPHIVTKKFSGSQFSKTPDFVLAVSGGGKSS